MIELYDKGLNITHREALKGAVFDLNKIDVRDSDKLILLGTKNLLRGLWKSFRAKNLTIYLTGFGRLYSEYGLAGRAIFFSILLLYKLKRDISFIVENEHDAKVIKIIFSSKQHISF